jgi:hypothetical protein
MVEEVPDVEKEEKQLVAGGLGMDGVVHCKSAGWAGTMKVAADTRLPQPAYYTALARFLNPRAALVIR